MLHTRQVFLADNQRRQKAQHGIAGRQCQYAACLQCLQHRSHFGLQFEADQQPKATHFAHGGYCGSAQGLHERSAQAFRALRQLLGLQRMQGSECCSARQRVSTKS